MALLPEDPRVQRRILAAIVPVILLATYWFLGYGPQREEVARLSARLEVLEGRNISARARSLQGGAELERLLGLYEEQILRLEELVPRSDELPELLYDLTLRARENGVELARLNPHGDLPGPFYTLHRYDIAVIGTYHDIGRYLAAIGSLPRIVTAYDLRLQPRRERDSSGVTRLQAEFRIKTYALPPALPVVS